MMNAADSMVVMTSVSLALLLFSYTRTGVRGSDFGNVPNVLWPYLLLTAAICFACLTAIIAMLYGRRHEVSDKTFFQVGTSASLYLLLQILFIPAVRSGKKRLVQLLLITCTIPILVLYSSVIMYQDIGGLAAYCVAHVAINDAVMYGALF